MLLLLRPTAQCSTVATMEILDVVAVQTIFLRGCFTHDFYDAAGETSNNLFGLLTRLQKKQKKTGSSDLD